MTEYLCIGYVIFISYYLAGGTMIVGLWQERSDVMYLGIFGALGSAALALDVYNGGWV